MDAAERAERDNIPNWLGYAMPLCKHYVEPQPMRPVDVKTPWGTPMTFVASEIKGY